MGFEMQQTIQQQRAKYAMDEITALTKKLSPEQQKIFVAYAHSLPAMIHSNGLGQSMAFCKSKGSASGLNEKEDKKRSYNALYNIISDWLIQPTQIYSGCANVLSGITSKDMQSYQLAQVETLELLSWVKKFAAALLIHDKE